MEIFLSCELFTYFRQGHSPFKPMNFFKLKLILILLLVNTQVMSRQENAELDAAERLAKYSNWAYIGLGLLVVFSTIAVYITSSRAQTIAKSIADAQVAEAKKEAAKANEGAEIAKANAAKANRVAEDLKKSNLVLETNLAHTVADVEKEKQKVASVQIEVATAKERQAKAERELLELQEKMRPRSLTNEQQSALVSLLSKSQKGPIYIPLEQLDRESSDYATAFYSLLEKAGWPVKRIHYKPIVSQQGILLVVNPNDTTLKYLVELQHIFGEVGIELPTALNKDLAEGHTTLYIGTK